MTDDLFGELRSLCHDPTRPFDSVCRLLDRWPAGTLEDVAIPYAVEHTRGWAHRPAPLRWRVRLAREGSEPRLRLCDEIDLRPMTRFGSRVDWADAPARPEQFENVRRFHAGGMAPGWYDAMPSLEHVTVRSGDEAAIDALREGARCLDGLSWYGEALTEAQLDALDAAFGPLSAFHVFAPDDFWDAASGWFVRRWAELDAFSCGLRPQHHAWHDALSSESCAPRAHSLSLIAMADLRVGARLERLRRLALFTTFGNGLGEMLTDQRFLLGLEELHLLGPWHTLSVLQLLEWQHQACALRALTLPDRASEERVRRFLASEAMANVESFCMMGELAPILFETLVTNPHVHELRVLRAQIRPDLETSTWADGFASLDRLERLAMSPRYRGAHERLSSFAPVFDAISHIPTLIELMLPECIVDAPLSLPPGIEILSMGNAVLQQGTSLEGVLSSNTLDRLRIVHLPYLEEGLERDISFLFDACPRLEAIILAGSRDQEILDQSARVLERAQARDVFAILAQYGYVSRLDYWVDPFSVTSPLEM